MSAALAESRSSHHFAELASRLVVPRARAVRRVARTRTPWSTTKVWSRRSRAYQSGVWVMADGGTAVDAAASSGEATPTTSDFAAAEIELVCDLLNDPDWISRRVESVTVLSSTLRERRMSIDVSVSGLKSRVAQFYDSPPASVRAPVAVLRKGLIFDFDVRDHRGHAVSLSSRTVDSALAQAVMCHTGSEQRPARDRTTGVQANNDPTDTIEALLYELAYQFEPLEDALILTRSDPAASLDALATAMGQTLTQEDYDWWTLAWGSPTFRHFVHLFAEHFLAVVEVRRSATNGIFKIRRLEPASDSTWGEETGQSKDLAIRFSELGRAASEHLRVIAPSGTFFTDPVLFRETPGEMEYEERIALDRVAIYAHGVEPGETILHLKIWPKRSGFMRPATFLSGYGALVLLLGGLAERITQSHWGDDQGFLWKLSGSAGVAMTLLVSIPTILIAYLVRDGEHDIRSALLARWRSTALVSLLPLWVAAVSIILDRKHLASWTLWTLWLAAGALALLIHVSIQIQDGRLRRAYKKVKEASPQTSARDSKARART